MNSDWSPKPESNGVYLLSRGCSWTDIANPNITVRDTFWYHRRKMTLMVNNEIPDDPKEFAYIEFENERSLSKALTSKKIERLGQVAFDPKSKNMVVLSRLKLGKEFFTKNTGVRESTMMCTTGYGQPHKGRAVASCLLLIITTAAIHINNRLLLTIPGIIAVCMSHYISSPNHSERLKIGSVRNFLAAGRFFHKYNWPVDATKRASLRAEEIESARIFRIGVPREKVEVSTLAGRLLSVSGDDVWNVSDLKLSIENAWCIPKEFQQIFSGSDKQADPCVLVSETYIMLITPPADLSERVNGIQNLVKLLKRPRKFIDMTCGLSVAMACLEDENLRVRSFAKEAIELMTISDCARILDTLLQRWISVSSDIRDTWRGNGLCECLIASLDKCNCEKGKHPDDLRDCLQEQVLMDSLASLDDLGWSMRNWAQRQQ